MITRFLVSLFLVAGLVKNSPAQVKVPKKLEAIPINGGSIFHKNLDIGPYETTRFRRSIASFFSFQTPQLANLLKIAGIPLIKKEHRYSTDVFNFKLRYMGQTISRVEADAVFNKKENFRLLSKQDSTFFGKANVDVIAATVIIENDGATWHMVASNLNGSKAAAQDGIIKNGDQEIRFYKTNLLLPGTVTSKTPIGNLHQELQTVYAFTRNEEIVAAVSFYKRGRRLWLHTDLTEAERTVITSISALLIKRRPLYR
jgi:hypothetical protein